MQADGNYKMISNEKNGIDHRTQNIFFEDLTIKASKTLKFYNDCSNQKTIGKGIYKVVHEDPEYRFEVIFASTYEIQDNDEYKMEVKNGNFEREANNLIEKFNSFIKRMDNLENPQE